MTVTLTTAGTLVKEVEFPRGHAGNPMTDAEVEHEVPHAGRAALRQGDGRSHAGAVLGAGEAEGRG